MATELRHQFQTIKNVQSNLISKQLGDFLNKMSLNKTEKAYCL